MARGAKVAVSPGIGFGEAVTGGDGGPTVTASTGTEVHKAICEYIERVVILKLDGVVSKLLFFPVYPDGLTISFDRV